MNIDDCYQFGPNENLAQRDTFTPDYTHSAEFSGNVTHSTAVFRRSLTQAEEDCIRQILAMSDLRYQIGVPIMFAIGILAVAANVLVACSVRWVKHRNMSSNLVLALSLALADSATVCFMLLGLLLNSYLPMGLGVLKSVDDGAQNCSRVVIEQLRLACILTSMLHLLALAINHLDGVRNPIHNRCGMRTSQVRKILCAVWILPFVALFVIAAIIPNQGFQRANCWSPYLYQLPFKISFCLAIVVLFVVTLVIYAYIFRFLVKAQSHRLSLIERGGLGSRRKKNQKKERTIRSKNAAVTSLLVVGTFGVGWLPSIIQYFLLCRMDCIFSQAGIDPNVIFGIQYVSNTFMLVKLLVNPAIYSARIPEVQCALYLMRMTCCGFATPDQDWEARMPRELHHLINSTVTPSIRVRRRLNEHHSLTNSSRSGTLKERCRKQTVDITDLDMNDGLATPAVTRKINSSNQLTLPTISELQKPRTFTWPKANKTSVLSV